ncbi:hypothetical protein DFH08DRAFT_824660 [Mycena albidolilacea]|uniref:Uncharacterized protein n=1 Tax=Mycena albidolilacea TaxID=1033008 RepID=A0AAD7EAW0_9AGAR|nr:hypothetical protein DFH08DRAFT_824660 [Mycena albidolilacea]
MQGLHQRGKEIEKYRLSVAFSLDHQFPARWWRCWGHTMEEDTGEGGDFDSIRSSRDGENPEPTEAKLCMPRIKTDYGAYVNFCGLPFNGNKATGKFDIDCEQYTQISKGGPTTVFPASCWIIDSPRWARDKKPMPFSNKFVSASGFLVGAEKRAVPGSPHSQHFLIDVDNVIYLGNNVAAGPTTVADNQTRQLLMPREWVVGFCFFVDNSTYRIYSEFFTPSSWEKTYILVSTTL